MTIDTFTGPPCRLQLRRKGGFKLQEFSRSLNGRSAVNCARPGPWGNPFFRDLDGHPWPPELAGQLFRAKLTEHGSFVNLKGETITVEEIRLRLAGKNLACFCKPIAPCCHCNVLLEVANG